jgi:hypothetical protein
MLEMDIGNAVYLVTDRQTTGAGVPEVICGLYERSARIAIEREEGTKTFDVPGKPWIAKGELRARCGKRTWSGS